MRYILKSYLFYLMVLSFSSCSEEDLLREKEKRKKQLEELDRKINAKKTLSPSSSPSPNKKRSSELSCKSGECLMLSLKDNCDKTLSNKEVIIKDYFDKDLTYKAKTNITGFFSIPYNFKERVIVCDLSTPCKSIVAKDNATLNLIGSCL